MTNIISVLVHLIDALRGRVKIFLFYFFFILIVLVLKFVEQGIIISFIPQGIIFLCSRRLLFLRNRLSSC